MLFGVFFGLDAAIVVFSFLDAFLLIRLDK